MSSDEALSQLKKAKDKLDSKYLYYVFMNLNTTQYWQRNGLVYGSLQLKNIRIEDVKNISLQVS